MGQPNSLRDDEIVFVIPRNRVDKLEYHLSIGVYLEYSTLL